MPAGRFIALSRTRQTPTRGGTKLQQLGRLTYHFPINHSSRYYRPGARSCLLDERRFRGHASCFQGGQDGHDDKRTTLTPCPRLRSCGRSRKSAPGAYRQARQAGGVFRRKIAHHRFCPLQRGEFRNPPDRGCNPIQGSQPDQASANGLELLSPGTEREFRYPAGEPARLGDELVPRNG